VTNKGVDKRKTECRKKFKPPIKRHGATDISGVDGGSRELPVSLYRKEYGKGSLQEVMPLVRFFLTFYLETVRFSTPQRLAIVYDFRRYTTLID